MKRNLPLALSLIIGAALLPTAAFAKDHDRGNDRGHWAEKDKHAKQIEHRDRRDERWRDWDHDRDLRWHREQERERNQHIVRMRDHEREEREARERRWRDEERQERLRREREWARQREWERKHHEMIAQHGPTHTPAGWNQGQKTGWKNCNVPPGQARPAGCPGAPLKPTTLPTQSRGRDNNVVRPAVPVREPYVRQQPTIAQRH